MRQEGKVEPSNESEKEEVQPTTIVFLSLTGTVALILLFVLLKVVPTFADVFASFGSDLPWPTESVIRLSWALQPASNPIGLPLATGTLALIGVLAQWKRVLGPKMAIGAFVLGLFFLLFVMASLFLPMFYLGDAVKN